MQVQSGMQSCDQTEVLLYAKLLTPRARREGGLEREREAPQVLDTVEFLDTADRPH